jgi:hypothetical protein
MSVPNANINLNKKTKVGIPTDLVPNVEGWVTTRVWRDQQVLSELKLIGTLWHLVTTQKLANLFGSILKDAGYPTDHLTFVTTYGETPMDGGQPVKKSGKGRTK